MWQENIHELQGTITILVLFNHELIQNKIINILGGVGHRNIPCITRGT